MHSSVLKSKNPVFFLIADTSIQSDNYKTAMHANK